MSVKGLEEMERRAERASSAAWRFFAYALGGVLAGRAILSGLRTSSVARNVALQ